MFFVIWISSSHGSELFVPRTVGLQKYDGIGHHYSQPVLMTSWPIEWDSYLSCECVVCISTYSYSSSVRSIFLNSHIQSVRPKCSVHRKSKITDSFWYPATLFSLKRYTLFIVYVVNVKWNVQKKRCKVWTVECHSGNKYMWFLGENIETCRFFCLVLDRYIAMKN